MNKLPQILGLGLIVDVVIIDQISKWAIMEHVLRPEIGGDSVGLLDWILHAPQRLGFVSIPVLSNFDLSMVWNFGVSFGMLQNMGIWPLVAMSGLVSSIFFAWLMKSQSKFEAISLSMIIGGAVGNIIDRLRFGAVADFFDIYVGTYHWPAFNIADSAITIGVAMLLIHGLVLNREEDKI